jgi:hypothetical protein
MRRIWHLLVVACLGLGTLAACGDDDTEERVDDAAEDLGEAAGNAWASFRTNWERLIDQASTGDTEAQDELLGECRDLLQDLREDDDPAADGVQSFCDSIRDADDDADWDATRETFEQLQESLDA